MTETRNRLTVGIDRRFLERLFGAKILGAHYDVDLDRYMIALESERFPEVPEGDFVSEAPLEVEQVEGRLWEIALLGERL